MADAIVSVVLGQLASIVRQQIEQGVTLSKERAENALTLKKKERVKKKKLKALKFQSMIALRLSSDPSTDTGSVLICIEGLDEDFPQINELNGKLYAFVVMNCNSFFPMFVMLYVIHYFLSSRLVAHGHGFIPLLLSSLLFMVAGSYYHYLNLLGYDGYGLKFDVGFNSFREAYSFIKMDALLLEEVPSADLFPRLAATFAPASLARTTQSKTIPITMLNQKLISSCTNDNNYAPLLHGSDSPEITIHQDSWLPFLVDIHSNQLLIGTGTENDD
ncbi:hypothetical protein EZV62_003905 [Acer yangbiense]|uniref:Uncharacterized protein n=1 Tax=Acer yangbiense TaxID=1000413 RepID=A0A5C7II63_9ROSI|nr:hypothetical protein EZV62_003905 [Acer yangbiense]